LNKAGKIVNRTGNTVDIIIKAIHEKVQTVGKKILQQVNWKEKK